MKQIFTYTLALVLALSLVASEASAQQFSKRKQYNSVGVTLSAMNYFGDVTPKPSIPSLRFGATRPSLGVTFTHRFTPRISARAGLSYGRITGDDSKAADPNDPDGKYRYNRNMSFRNDIAELAVVGIFDLIPNRNTYVKRPDLVPYVFGGVAGYIGNPKGLYNGTYVALQPLKTEGVAYDKGGIAIPFGGGVRYKVNKSFDVGLEIGFRKTFNDYLDDVSTVYVAQSSLGSEAARYFGGGNVLSSTGEFTNFNAPGSQRGKSDEDDWYVTTGITVNYILAPRVKSPKFR
ncbi:DUF6089 family protein [Hymenobacter sediminicola]|uniref:Outer membrane beta-barrel protein n=1 Tax=Hymenobacter sediminicola TaxID=2761579 RepID=A0A7G7W6A4_9BACT|nr:DUF6089 family protein [Hymenobacter sediminicola]QNH61897.1 outer membrane beta-barrel protein [Hymenobacter sediminicola]